MYVVINITKTLNQSPWVVLKWMNLWTNCEETFLYEFSLVSCEHIYIHLLFYEPKRKKKTLQEYHHKMHHYSVFSLTWPASMQTYWNKRKRLHKKRVQLPQDWFGTQTWPPFHWFGTQIWPPWHHVKTHNTHLHRAPKLALRLILEKFHKTI